MNRQSVNSAFYNSDNARFEIANPKGKSLVASQSFALETACNRPFRGIPRNAVTVAPDKDRTAVNALIDVAALYLSPIVKDFSLFPHFYRMNK
jgi:hypothetical protein